VHCEGVNCASLEFISSQFVSDVVEVVSPYQILGILLRSPIQTTPSSQPLTHPPSTTPLLSSPYNIRSTSSLRTVLIKMASPRTGFRFTQSARDSIFRNTPFARTQRQSFFRRFATAAPAVEGAPARKNIFQKLWTSPVGVKTVHFWYAKHPEGNGI
jgi:hypothetical protein